MSVIPMDYAWLGQKSASCVVLAYFCEDDLDELNRRQNAINQSMGIVDPQMQLKNFYLESRAGRENLLMTFEKGIGTPTPFYSQIVADIERTGATVVMLDNSAQLFGGNENDRREVTQFVNLLHRLASEHKVTPILLGHPAKGDGSEYSGSTAWDACFRSRIYLSRVKKGEDDKDDDIADLRILRRSKANYGRIGEEIVLRWKEGCFKVESGTAEDTVDRIDRQNLEKQVQRKFLELLDRLTEQGRNVSHSPQAKNYAPKVMASQPESGFSQKQFMAAMEQLLHDRTIEANVPIGQRGNRCKVFGLALRTEKNEVTDPPPCPPQPIEVIQNKKCKKSSKQQKPSKRVGRKVKHAV